MAFPSFSVTSEDTKEEEEESKDREEEKEEKDKKTKHHPCQQMRRLGGHWHCGERGQVPLVVCSDGRTVGPEVDNPGTKDILSQ